MPAATAHQLFDVQRTLAHLHTRALEVQALLRERDEAVAEALDVVIELLLRGDVSQSERWRMAATLTNARVLLTATGRG